MRVQLMARVLGAVAVGLWTTSVAITQSPPEAPAGFDGASNGFITGPAFEEAKAEFSGQETAADGVGPVFNGASCAECHSVPTVGGSSQVVERRAGRFNGTTFFDHPGGSLIQDRALDARVQETVLANHNVIALRSSLSILGDGFIEAIDSNDLVTIRNNQPAAMRGTFIQVPVLEAPGQSRGGRFGWKNQQASLLSFAADAYVNEMGITSPLQPTENSFNGNAAAVSALDLVADPEDDGADVQLFADFMRSTKVPPRDVQLANSSDAILGSSLFNSSGCNVCHTRTFVTSPRGTVINGGRFTVPTALGNKTIHPFSDFLLHDIATGDGIVQNGGQATRNMVRTPPLWGLRARGRFMHDLQSHSFTDAIQRHGGQAASARSSFNALSATDRNRILRFLASL